MFTTESKTVRLLALKVLGQITPEESALLERWVSESPANKALYGEVIDGSLMQKYDQDAACINREVELALIRHKLGVRHRRRVRLWWSTSATVAAAVIVGLFLWRPQTETPAPWDIPIPPLGSYHAVITVADAEPVYVTNNENDSEWRTLAEQLDSAPEAHTSAIPDIKIDVPRGNEYKVRLSDGTVVWLNSESSIAYPSEFSGEERSITLTGEAYFEVAHAQTPFVVRVSDVEIVVHGTSFNVSAYLLDDAVTTTLVSGSVELFAGDQTMTLTPGWQASISNSSGAITSREVDTSLYTSWREGVFEFDGMELAQICAQLARWYDVDFQFEGHSGRERFTGGAWKDKPLQEFLQKIERITDVSFSYQDGCVTVQPK